MSEHLRSQRFRAEREADWLRLDRLLERAEKKSIRALTDADLADIPVLYRGALSSLSVARATSLDQALVEYLESLAARAYFFVYGPREKPLKRLARYYAVDLPLAAQSLWRETLISALALLAGALIGYFLVQSDMEWFYSFMGDQAQGRDPTASTEKLAETLKGADAEGLTAFSTFLMTHNAQVAIFAFALGFAFCVPCVLLIGVQGLGLGALLALFQSRGLGVELGGWLTIHGSTELLAIILAGAAGTRIGWSVGFPGDKPRLEALVAAGRKSAALMGGVVTLLFFAGLLEGFGRQLIEATPVRYAVGGAMLTFWLVYLYAPRRPAA